MKTANRQPTKTFFDDLLEKAISEWPEEIDLSVIKNADEELNRFTVAGLGPLAEKIESHHIGKPKEVIMRNLHQAIFSAAHDIARFCTKIKIENIRKEMIKIDFEDRLRDALTNQGLGWGKEDMELIQEYFAKSISTD
jgi:hypothetical protein